MDSEPWLSMVRFGELESFQLVLSRKEPGTESSQGVSRLDFVVIRVRSGLWIAKKSMGKMDFIVRKISRITGIKTE
jgi:hypothetical protein